MSNTSQYIKFDNLELGRDFELNGTFFYKTGKLTAVSRTLGNPIEVNPSSMVEMVVTQEVFSKVKELLGQGEGGYLIGETIGFNQAEVGAVIRASWVQ
tara:strand:- start:10623 stop:10916 length:294 start_codon:yes stop_codon:yes gene_type:complete